MILINLDQAVCLFTQDVAKVSKPGLRRTLPHFDKLLKYFIIFLLQWCVLCCWYLLPTQNSWVFSLRKVLTVHLLSGSQHHITAVIWFSFTWRLCSCCVLLDKVFVFEFLTKCLCYLSPGQDNGLIWEQDKASASIWTGLFCMVGQKVLCQLVLLNNSFCTLQ